MTHLTPEAVASYARNAGWSGTDLVVAVAVALAESGGDTNAHATKGEDSRGLWQMNVRAHPDLANVNLYDPDQNAKAAYNLWKSQGWGPWSTHNNGAYLLYMPIATAAVNAYYVLHPQNAPGDAANALTPQPIKDAAAAALEVAKVPVKILTWLTSPGTQVRIAKVIVGGGLVLIGLYIFARPVVEPVVKTGAKVGEAAALL